MTNILQDTVISKKIDKELLDILLSDKIDGALFSFISSFYSLKSWNSDDLFDIYNLLKKSNSSLQQYNNWDSIAITATGGELNTRTLYVTPIIAFILSIYKPTFLQGNKAITGCGCGNFAEADIMNMLGIKMTTATNALYILQEDNLAFLHALIYHSILKKYHEIRACLGFRDIFKVASTLADPYSSSNLFLCVYSEEQLKYSASILSKRNTTHSIIVTGLDGIDEASLKGKSKLADIKGDKIEYIDFYPEDYGFHSINSLSEIGSVPDLTTECNTIIDILKNEEQGNKTQLCILNAGIALYAADVTQSIGEGINLARKTIESGDVYKKYLSLIRK
ncbi:MAG: hypothetical protein LBH32_08605 [Dysgonamonadaceae bacterium]|jgi:anthranilate phosphoribosyltransferase|nr:hypothetical protein [Dysgonamonadaceae bacterium]